MPKKSTRHAHVRQTASSATAVATAAAATATASPDSAGSGLHEKPNKRHRSVHIGPKNGRRWLSLKKRLGLPTDDDLVVYLLDLAESITERRDEIQCAVEKKVITPTETSSDVHERPRRSQRNIVAAEESLKNDKSEKLDKVVNSPANQDKIIQQDSKSYSKSCSRPSKVKRHKNKARHHKEKRKKKKHQKIKDLKNLLTLENKISNNIFWQFDSESDAEKCSTDLQENFISQTITDQSSKDFDLEDSDNRAETCEKLPHDTGAQTISSEVNRTNEFIDHNLVHQTCVQEQIDIRTIQSLDAQELQVQSKSNKPLADSLEPNQSSVEHSTSHSSNELDLKSAQITDYSNLTNKHKRSKREANETYDLSEGLDTSYSDDSKSITYKPDKKRHKSGDQQNKKHHDVRKAPQDGIITGDESQDFLNCTNNLMPMTSANPVPDNSTLPSEAIIGSSEVEPPRLAIKIKLCQECNSRHLQDACPLTEPQYTIKDSISLEQWVQKHDRNSEAMKAFNSNDPMSQGYGNHADDGFDSDEEASEQYKSKNKRECEEKQLTVDVNRPLYGRDSLPECLDFKLSNTDHGLGVFVKSLIPMYAQLGPLIGKTVQEMDIPDDFSMRHIWEVDINNKTMYISTTNPLTSNWIRYVRPAETKEDRNVALISKNGELFLVTTKSLIAGTELTYWSDSQSTAWTRKNKVDKTNCGGCNLNFTHPIYYRLHCCIFHDTNYSLTIRKYHCKVCGAAVLGKDNIMKHAAQLHAGRGAYQCQYCKKFFLRLNYLEMHRTYGCSQNPQRSRPLCDFCGRKFCQPQKLKVHIKRMHSDMSEVLREFQCKLCLKLLGSRAALQRHMKEVHHKDVVGAATCDRCGKMFQNKSNLKIHMLTHSGVKPFKCKENGCKAAFTTKQCLQFHYKKVHGLSEEKMPKIERSVAYTFDAYSGGLVEDAGRGKTPKFNASSAQENSDSLASFDECSSENNNATFAADVPCSSNSSSSKQLKECEESNHQISVVVPSNAESPVESVDSDVDLYGSSRVSNKDNKKWISEFDPAPSTPPATSSTDIYSFHENKRDDEKIHSSNQSLIDDSTKLGLSMYRRTESANASLLVEAALDAAEREIGAVSSPILEDSDREANLYSITNELDFKTTCSQNQVVQRSPESGHLDSYMQNELVAASPETNSHTRHTPPGHMHLDYHIHRSVEYVNTTGRAHNIEQYLDQQEVQRVEHVSQQVPTSPSRYQEIPHPHSHSHSHAHSLSHTLSHPHTHPHHHQITTDALSDDEGDSVAQNLSLPIKDKSLQQLDLTKYDGLESEFSVVNRERVRFEPLIVQSTADQGLDMSARGFQHTFGSQAQNSSHNHHHHHHHHHQLYEMNERERQGVDLSRTSACMPSPPYPPHPYPHPYSHVDVPRVVSLESTSRSHHLHTSVSRIISTSPQPANSLTPHIVSEGLETRILSPPPSMPTYNTTYSVGPPYHTSRPGYHYSGYY